MLNPSIQVLALPFKKGTKRADKANAVELYVSLTEGDELDEVDAIEKEAFDKLMDGASFAPRTCVVRKGAPNNSHRLFLRPRPPPHQGG